MRCARGGKRRYRPKHHTRNLHKRVWLLLVDDGVAVAAPRRSAQCGGGLLAATGLGGDAAGE